MWIRQVFTRGVSLWNNRENRLFFRYVTWYWWKWHDLVICVGKKKCKVQIRSGEEPPIQMLMARGLREQQWIVTRRGRQQLTKGHSKRIEKSCSRPTRGRFSCSRLSDPTGPAPNEREKITNRFGWAGFSCFLVDFFHFVWSFFLSLVGAICGREEQLIFKS